MTDSSYARRPLRLVSKDRGYSATVFGSCLHRRSPAPSSAGNSIRDENHHPLTLQKSRLHGDAGVHPSTFETLEANVPQRGGRETVNQIRPSSMAHPSRNAMSLLLHSRLSPPAYGRVSPMPQTSGIESQFIARLHHLCCFQQESSFHQASRTSRGHKPSLCFFFLQ
ncbi:hypothetical protein MHUMG1_03234 [Metarhizium humberi]|uniref:Uncharacterized protein n=1 Tax=Metarhizium humberi TaxID=2596975 RepID=A0A9P8SAA2_9HYPO|nr:hypothetical protein MHUMG1_03234 [Metarhizium humberi]